MNRIANQMTTARVAARIRIINGQAVLFASDIAALYGMREDEISSVVERQPEIFPGDFICRRSQGEFVFNEQGASMLAALLCDTCSVTAGIAIMRAFVFLRRKYPPKSLKTCALANDGRHATRRSRVRVSRRDRNPKI
jgi:hypothetical protein